MKKIFIALMAAAAMTFTGCTGLLDIPQKGVVSYDSFYQTDEDAESALVTAYYIAGRFYSNSMNTSAGWNECPFLALWEYASDDMFVAGQNKQDGVSGNELQTYRHDMNNAVIQGTYECYYMIINQCNNVILNFENKENATPTMKRCVAEARVLRAYTQMLLALAWGTAPVIDYQLTGADKPENAESQEAVLKWVAAQCDAAIADLTSKSDVNDRNKALIVTKEFAYAVKGKALLSIHDYAGAKTALKQVIDSKKYALVASDKMETLNHNSGKASTEAVFELSYNYDPSLANYYRTQPNYRWLWSWRADQFASNGPRGEFTANGWGWCNPSDKFVNTILEHDGYDSARRKAWIKSYDEILYEMPWLSDANCPTKADKEADVNRGITWAAGIYGNVGYFQWKRLFRVEDQVADGNVADWNLTIMRYAEVLLMYAEACAMTTDDGSGLKALQEVNERAQAKTKITALTMENVKTEKFLECWLDATRWQDLIRWGDAEKELGNSGKYYPSFCDALHTKGEAKHRGYIDESDADWAAKLYDCGFKKGKNELFPFPFCEIQVNPNIKQNPGY